jgi:hypothetical protein
MLYPWRPQRTLLRPCSGKREYDRQLGGTAVGGDGVHEVLPAVQPADGRYAAPARHYEELVVALSLNLRKRDWWLSLERASGCGVSFRNA